MPTTPLICPNCGSAAGGKFCSSCGAAVAGGTCASCQGELAPGAKFCHRCGAPAGAGPSAGAARKSAAPPKKAANSAPPSPAATGFAAAAPWAVAGIALVALIALVAKYSFGDGDAPADGQQPLAGMASGAPFAGGGGGAAAVDLNSMTPRQIAERLYNRVMRLDSEGKKDSIGFFAPMAVQAFQMIPDQDADTRYDLGRIAQVAGMLPVAKAEADTILKAEPKNLLGLTLAMRTARAMGNAKEASAYGKRLIAAAPTERTKDAPGYQLHSADLDEALKEAAK